MNKINFIWINMAIPETDARWWLSFSKTDSITVAEIDERNYYDGIGEKRKVIKYFRAKIMLPGIGYREFDKIEDAKMESEKIITWWFENILIGGIPDNSI